jgi:hypothetical protein
MTLRNAPLVGRDAEGYRVICDAVKQKYFSKRGLTRLAQSSPTGKSLAVIPGHREAMSYDVQLHIRESITTAWGYGFRACALWRIYDVQLHIGE